MLEGHALCQVQVLYAGQGSQPLHQRELYRGITISTRAHNAQRLQHRVLPKLHHLGCVVVQSPQLGTAAHCMQSHRALFRVSGFRLRFIRHREDGATRTLQASIITSVV